LKNITKTSLEPLDEYWVDSVTDFADFLEKCGGLEPLKPLDEEEFFGKGQERHK
jgi:hypothetical protein